jgi:rare lipoprotein A
MKHRIQKGRTRYGLHLGRPRVGSWWIPVLRRLRQPGTLAIVAAIAVAAGGVATWQVTSSGAPHRTNADGARVLPLPAQPSTVDDEERASRSFPRHATPEARVTPSAGYSSAPGATAPVTTAAKPPLTQPPMTQPPVTRTPAPPVPSRAPQPTSPAPTDVGDGQYVPIGPSFSGQASFYGGGDGTDGGPTASGETFDANALTAASPTLPFDTLLNVCYQERCVVVRINDRGPFVGGRILDLSARAAQLIGMEQVGVAPITATPVRLAG